jgi:1,4-alpha-glucan branching enzyme
VAVAGTFNGWNPEKTPLKKNGEAWERTVALPRGRYEYRFVVDGQWVADPSVRESVPNPFGSTNSVLNV